MSSILGRTRACFQSSSFPKTILMKLGVIILKLGYADADITPSFPVETVGFNRPDNLLKGTLKPLLAQVAVWQENGSYCLITIDSIGFKKELADNLRKRVCKALNTSFERVMICFSHCHSAPNADTITGLLRNGVRES